MIYNEDTYYMGYHKNVRAIGAVPALVFDTICGLLRDPENETGEIANSTLCDLLGITPQGLRKIISKLIDDGFIMKSTAAGRGNKTLYALTEKGKQCCPFMSEKRETRFPKKGNVVSQKGKRGFPINTELNKELKKGETPTPIIVEKEKFNGMESMFEEFWKLYPGDPDWSYDKNHCEDVWDRMDPEYQQKLLVQLRSGLRWRDKPNDKPYYYLLDYRGQDVQVELPIMRQGTVKFTQWIADAEKDGEQVCLLWETVGDKRNLVYCLERDRKLCEASGLQFLRNM